MIQYPAVEACCVNENIWSESETVSVCVCVCEQMHVQVHNDTYPLNPC